MFGKALLMLGIALTMSQVTLAKDYYATPSGAGNQNGLSWENAFSESKVKNDDIPDMLMLPGDVLHLGSGTYSQTIILESSGTPLDPKRIVGENTGGGLPLMDLGDWFPATHTGTTGSAISFKNAASYWSIENLIIRDVRHGVKTETPPAGQYLGITLRNLTIRNCQHPVYIFEAKGWLIENIDAREYTKQGFHFRYIGTMTASRST
jgi:hypothetical protein